MDIQEKQDLLIQFVDQTVQVKLNLYHQALNWFQTWQAINQDIAREIKELFEQKGLSQVRVAFEQIGAFEHRLTIGGETLIFVLHSNIFKLPPESSYMRTEYVREDPTRAYGALIYIYNFLHDTLYFLRLQDSGVLIARVFVNKDGYFFVEGQRQMGFLFTRWPENKLDAQTMKTITYSAFLTALSIELRLPPYAQEQVITFRQFLAQSGMRAIKTARRPGFQLDLNSESET